MQVSERSIFEKIGRLYIETQELHAENQELREQVERLTATAEQLRASLDKCQCLPATPPGDLQTANGALEANKKPGV